MNRLRFAFMSTALAALPIFTGCGGGGAAAPSPFSTDWTDDRGASIEHVRLRLAGARAPSQLDIAIGIVDDSHLVGLPLTSHSPPWTFVHPLDARPDIAGDVVVGSGNGEVFALDGRTGKELWKRPTGGLPLKSVGDDGTTTVVILERTGGRGSTLLAVARDGSVVRQIETAQTLGAPAMVSGLAFVPWGSQYVSVLDIADGSELGRVTFRETIDHAWVFGGSVFFGERGIFRFDSHIGQASQDHATHLTLPERTLPGVVRMFPPPQNHVPVSANAFDEARLYARATPGEGAIALENDRLYATYFRLLMGLDAKGKLAWVRHVEGDSLGGAAGVNVMASCDGSGLVSIYAASDGGVYEQKDLGTQVKSCVVQLDGYQPEGAAQPAGTRSEQLAAVLRLTDAQLVPAQRALLADLSDDPSDQATTLLLELSADPRVAPELADDARQRIAARRSGADALLKELARHYDFVHDILRPPPVAALAGALAAMRETRAAKPLVEHLFDPADADEDIRGAAQALETLAGPDEMDALAHFFSAYRATTENDVLADAAAAAARTLYRQGSPDQKSKVTDAVKDPTTTDALRARIRNLK